MTVQLAAGDPEEEEEMCAVTKGVCVHVCSHGRRGSLTYQRDS